MSTANLVDAEGRHTGAVYGYLNMLIKLISDLKPTHAIAAFDMKAPTFRHKEYDGYKAKRKPMPDELVEQLPVLREVLGAMGIYIAEKEGYEADDIIGTVAKRFDVDTCIITGDKDSLQLIDYNTFVYRTVKGVTDIVRYDEKYLHEKEGFKPYQIIEYKAIAGDSSDNIPGCPGIGDKGARELLQAYDNVDGIYENIASVKPAVAKKLLDNRETVELSRHLATIDCDVPIDICLDDLLFTPNVKEIVSICNKYNFNSTVGRVIKEFGGEDVRVNAEENPVNVVETELSDLKQLLKKDRSPIAIHMADDVTVSTDGKTEYKIVLPKTLFDFDSESNPEEIFLYLFSLPNKKILFNAKSYLYFLDGKVLSDKNFDDVQIISYLINSSESSASIGDVAKRYGYRDEIGAGILMRLYNKFVNVLEEDGLVELYEKVEKPLVKVLFSMEKAGLKVNVDTLKVMRKKLNDDIKELLDRIYEISGENFNVNSPQQLGKVLFEKMGIPTKQKKISVAADVLENIDHPIIPPILQYRHKQKLLSTYIDGLEPLIEKSSHMVHTSFNQCLTVTGRLSSTEPNLQNIPVRDDEGREIRKMFEATADSVLISADYSQIELRLLAHFSQDEQLIDAYLSGRDIHRETASKIFNIPIDEVTSQQRRSAKAVNFGIIYGISSFGLANNIGISPREAKDFQTRYFETFPRVEQFMKSNVAEAYEKGYIKTLMGRIRRLPELKSTNRNIRNFGERCAMNMPLQGTASDIIKIAMLRVYEAIEKAGLKAKLILQVHDELIVDAPIEEAAQVKSILKKEMESAVKLRVPLVVELGEGKTWYEAK